MLAPDLSVTLSQRRWRGVLDPQLVLSSWGLPLVRQLATRLELWMVRELWHILDNTEFYRVSGLSAARSGVGSNRREGAASAGEEWILACWEQLRRETNLGGLPLWFLTDCLADSMVPGDADPALFWRYEALARALDLRMGSSSPLAAATRDAAALATALDNAVILTLRGDTANDSPPLVRTWMSWGLLATRVPPGDPLAQGERDFFRQVIVQSGAAHLFWSGLDLVAARVLVPRATGLTRVEPDKPFDASETELDVTADVDHASLWRDAQLFWHPVYEAAELTGGRERRRDDPERRGIGRAA